jgi:two-component system, response regulator YesN
MSLTHNDLHIVAQVMAILNKEYKLRHSHSSLANRFHISDRKLREIFKRVTGKTINDFLTAVRIEKAKELLCKTDDPIKKIASSVGYYTRNLEKQFKFYTGMTPLDWRNKNQESTTIS